MNFGNIKSIEPGQVLFLDQDRKVHTKRLAHCRHSPCLFEWVYFARPDSIIDNANVYKVRVNLGRFLAAEIRKRKLPIDVVVPVPDSARDAAIEIARKLDLKYSEALVKNRYIGRTFIMPADDKRKSSVRQKLNPDRLRGQGQARPPRRRQHRPRQHVAGDHRDGPGVRRQEGLPRLLLAPAPLPCVYGIDMQTKTEFVARNADEATVAKRIGADKVIYQSLDALKKAVMLENPKLGEFCAACFDGVYPTGDISPELLNEIESERAHARDDQLELNI